MGVRRAARLEPASHDLHDLEANLPLPGLRAGDWLRVRAFAPGGTPDIEAIAHVQVRAELSDVGGNGLREDGILIGACRGKSNEQNQSRSSDCQRVRYRAHRFAPSASGQCPVLAPEPVRSFPVGLQSRSHRRWTSFGRHTSQADPTMEDVIYVQLTIAVS